MSLTGDYHLIALRQLFADLNVDNNGLTSAEAKRRLPKYGFNTVERVKKTALVIRYLAQYTNLFALLLLAGAALSLIADFLLPHAGHLQIAIALLVVAILNATFTFYQEYRADKIMEKFLAMIPAKAQVWRDGKPLTILAKNIVPGDIILLTEGDKIPADARLIEVTQLKVDHSALTGEAEPQLRSLRATHKNILESRNMVFSGTTVASGSGKALVYATGQQTQLGSIAELTAKISLKETPIRKELRRFIRIISTIALIIGVLFFLVSLFLGRGFWQDMVYMIGIIVANVPEGLLPTVTLCLSIASQRMAKKKALIKHLESVETLGSTTVICTDKTGTITENKLSVKNIFIDQKKLSANEFIAQNISGAKKLLSTIVLCNNALPNHGDPLEIALLKFARRQIDYKLIRENNQRLFEEPFDSNTRRMITINKSRNHETAYLKGAPETVWKKCDKILLNDQVVDFTQEHKENIEQAYRDFSVKGERVLALAFKPLTNAHKNMREHGFIFIGLISLVDFPRAGVATAVAKCHKAHIKVIMITGDFPLTAEAIARQVGIIASSNPTIVTGDELEKLSRKELQKVLANKEVLFARTSPFQKLKIVEELQRMGEIVAATGDGVNDAPAIKNADIGIAMGIMGTDVAKESADMILMDDHFATIVKAIEEGRAIFDNIKKFIAYILTSNVPEIIPFIAFVLLGIPLPLTVALILAIDLGTDLIPALGLGVEKPEKDLMLRYPRAKKEHLASRNLVLVSYGIIGPIEALAGFFAYFYLLYSGGWHWGEHLSYSNPLYQQAITAFFVSIILCQIFNVFARRTREQTIFNKQFFTNKLLLFGVGTEILLTLILVYVPAANHFFNTHSLKIYELFLALPFGLLIFFGEELRRWLLRQGNKFVNTYLKW